MKILTFKDRAIALSAAALLAGCGGSQPPIGAPGATSISAAHAQKNPAQNVSRGTGTMEFVYVANHYSDNVSAYAIDASTGALTEVKGSPFGTSYGPYGVAIDPSGKFAYVANNCAAGKPGSVSAFTINPHRSLGAGARVAVCSGNQSALSGDPF